MNSILFATCLLLVILIFKVNGTKDTVRIMYPDEFSFHVRMHLSSWDESSPTIRRIVNFTETIVPKLPLESRIATFDCDGTIMTEMPTYVETLLSYHALCVDNVGHKGTHFEKICSTSIFEMNKLNSEEVDELLLLTFANWTRDEFDSYTKHFVTSVDGCIVKNVRQPCINLIFQPMKELIQFLTRVHQFKVFIVTGSQQYVVRTLLESAFEADVEIQNRISVIGTTVKNKITIDPNHVSKLKVPSLELKLSNSNKLPVEFRRTNEYDIIVYNQVKVQEIYRFTPYAPLISFGNDNNDIQTFYYSMSHSLGREYSLCSLVHHNDEEREYYYDKLSNTTLGEEALRWNWNIIRMKEEWKRVF